jgi:hypothetical protein
VGQAALEKLPGVKKVEKGFYQSEEINTVVYDPRRIEVGALERALRQAGTYRRTLKGN